MDADPDLRKINLVTVGCPHASLTEIEQVAEYLAGKTLATRLWVTTGEITRQPRPSWAMSRPSRPPAAKVVADTCRGGRADADARRPHHGNQRRQDGLLRAMHSGVRMRFGDLEACLDAAVTGEWREQRVTSES